MWLVCTFIEDMHVDAGASCKCKWTWQFRRRTFPLPGGRAPRRRRECSSRCAWTAAAAANSLPADSSCSPISRSLLSPSQLIFVSIYKTCVFTYYNVRRGSREVTSIWYLNPLHLGPIDRGGFFKAVIFDLTLLSLLTSYKQLNLHWQIHYHNRFM